MDHLLTQEQLDYREKVYTYFTQKLGPIADELEKKNEFPMEIYKQLGRDGFLSINIPIEYGGKGLDSICSALLLEEVAKISPGVAVSIFTTMSGPLIILSIGTDEQKKRYLSAISSGETIIAFCLSESNAGSYNLGMETTAVLDGDYYVINGNKIFVTNGSVADLYLVVAYTDKSKGNKGISTFLVEGETPGISLLKKLEKLGWDSSDTAEIAFDNVRIPKENRLAQEGVGLLQALDMLNFGRVLQGATSVGLAKSVYDLCRSYILSEKAPGEQLSRRQYFRHKLAQMSLKVETCDLLVWSTMKKRDMGLKYIKEASYCKSFCGHVAREMALDAMNLFGEQVFVDYYSKMSMWFRGAPAQTIADGTQEIQFEVISREIGLGKDFM